ncbi:MAG: Amuc_1100 family pilus-like protein [Candidatus Omnitrophica bacterium]|nr:Amuc_1100 family pilus-like protein [Candidatus Omnitrophota bacterium]
MSESLTTKVSLGAVILVSFLFLGVTVYDRWRIERAVVQKQQELEVYKNQGLGFLSSEKNRLDRQLKSMQEADKEISGMLFSKPSSRMVKEAGDPLKFKEELYKVQNKIKEEGASISFQFPFWLGFDRYEHDIPNPTDLPFRVKQLDIIKEIGNLVLASKAPEISTIEFLEIKKITADNKEILYMEFPVKVILKCNNENLVNFMYKLSVADMPFRVDSFKIKVSLDEAAPDGELTAEMVIVAAVLPAEKL